MANKIEVDVEVKDGSGSMQKVALEANKAGAGLNNAAAGSDNYAKKAKGVAGATSNSTKAFAKMQMGTGGLVGAYASLAAQLFAVSAAFNFLKSAGDLKVLQQGQVAYAASTGVAMGFLARQIQEATDAQITFQDASQAAAIGTAAGLSQQQLKDLGTAAKDASLILGRDVTDSFNRLVRGVTKAEPELLDELGVILRLNDANEKYAAKLGKSASELTQFEKSQAVANDVLEQTQQKYSAIIGDDLAVNQYAQLGKAFDSILNKVKELVDVIVGPFAKVLTETPILGVAAMGLLVKGPLAAMGFEFGNVTKKSKEALEVQRTNFTAMQENAAKAKLSIESLTKSIQSQSKAFVDAGSQSKILAKVSSGAPMSGLDKANIEKALRAAEAEYARSSKITVGIFKNMDIEIVRDFKLAMQQMEIAEQGVVTKTKVLEAQVKLSMAGVKLAFQTAKTAVITFGAALLNALGWISLIASMFMMAADYFGWFQKEMTQAEKDAEALTEKLKQLNKEYSDFARIQTQLLSRSGAASGAYASLGNILGALSPEENIKGLQNYAKLRAELAGIENTANRQFAKGNLEAAIMADKLAARKRERIEEEFRIYEDMEKVASRALAVDMGRNTVAKEFVDILRNGGTADEIEKAFLNMQNLGQSIEASAASFKAMRQSAASFFGNIKLTTAGDNVITEIDKTFTSMEDRLSSVSINVDFETGDMEASIASVIKQIEDTREAMMTPIPGFVGPMAGDSFLKEELIELTEMLDLRKKIEVIVQQEHEAKKALTKLELERAKALDAALPYEEKSVTAAQDILKLVQEQTNLDGQKAALLTAEKKTEDELTGAAKRTWETYIDQGEQLEYNIQVAKRRQAIESAILQLNQEIYYLQIDSTLQNIKKEQLEMLSKEAGFKQSILDNEQKLAELQMNAANRTANRGIVAGMKEAAGILEQEQAKKRLELETTFIEAKIEAINFEFDQKAKSIEMEYDLLKYKLEIAARTAEIESTRLGMPGEGQDLTASFAQGQIARINREMLAQIDTTKSSALAANESDRKTGVAGLLDRLKELEVLNENLQDTAGILNTIGRTFVSTFQEAISSLIQGTTTVKQAFANMAQAILKSIAEIIAQLLVANILKQGLSWFSGGGFNPASLNTPSSFNSTLDIASATSFGGTARYGGMFEPFANGGISRGRDAGYPVLLHGTEAVVPLPNGNAIPVEMRGAAGSQNNVTVNVSVDSNGNASSSMQQDSQQAGNLGQVIARAVQQELQNQKRSGGILNPYGAA